MKEFTEEYICGDIHEYMLLNVCRGIYRCRRRQTLMTAMRADRRDRGRLIEARIGSNSTETLSCREATKSNSEKDWRRQQSVACNDRIT